MSDITVSIPSDPIRSLVISVLKDELQPTLYGNDNTLVGVIHDEIEVSPRIQEHIKSVVINTLLHSSEAEDFVNDAISSAADNSRSFRRAVESAVEGCIDYAEIAQGIDSSDICRHLDCSDIASDIDLGDLANEICMDSLADSLLEKGFDYKALAKALLREIRAETEAANKTNA